MKLQITVLDAVISTKIKALLFAALMYAIMAAPALAVVVVKR